MEEEKTLDPHKIITSYKIEGPGETAVITLTRLEGGIIEVELSGGFKTETSTHKSYPRAIAVAANYAKVLIDDRILG